MSNQELYQKLYDDPKRKYGQAEHDRCPGVRLIPYYQKYISGDVVDFGCGTGDTILALKNIGFSMKGYDFIEPQIALCEQADITEPLDVTATTGLCIDVFEHLHTEPLMGLIENLKKCKRQIISIHNGPSSEGGKVELHINKKSFNMWEKFLGWHFKVKEKIRIHDFQMLYICDRRKEK